MKSFICTKDCIEACHLKIDDALKFHPEKRFTKHPFVCGKLKKFLKKEIFSDEKSFYVENGSKFSTTFKEITSRVSKKLQSIKEKNILYLRGSGSIGYMNYAWDILMSNFPNIHFIDGSICLSTGEEAHLEDFGVITNPPISNLENVENIVLFGRDAWNVAPHLYSYLKYLKKKGKNILYIDPIKSNTTKISTDYIRIKPATDAYLVAAILQELKLIKTEKSTDKLLNLSGLVYNDLKISLKYIFSKNTGIITGFGLQRYSNGKNIVQWINRLAYLTENIDTLYYDRGSKYGLPKRLINNPKINISEILEKLEDRFFDAVFIVASNPLVSYPSTKRLKDALLKLNTIIVVDTNITETAEVATEFIKVGGMFAQEDICGSYFYDDRMAIREKIVDIYSDLDAVKEIAKNLNIDLKFELPELPEKEKYQPRSYKSNDLKLINPIYSNQYRLITRSHYSYINSQNFGDFNENYIYISQNDADKLSLKNFDKILIKGNGCSAEALVKISDECGEGYIFAYKCQNLISGQPNLFTQFIPTDSNKGIAIYDTFVKLEKIVS